MPAFAIVRRLNDVQVHLGPGLRDNRPFLSGISEQHAGFGDPGHQNNLCCPPLATLWPHKDGKQSGCALLLSHHGESCRCCSKAGFEKSNMFHEEGSGFGHLLYLPRHGKVN